MTRFGLHRRVLGAEPGLLCRWDLDKTYLRSEFDTLRQLWRTARERGEDKVEVPGVAELMKAIRAAADRRGRPAQVFFISASPPQIGKAIRDKLALDGVPYDGIVFKDQLEQIKRGKFRNLREHVGFKLTELLRGRLAAAEGAQELLFGDDWESDSLTYSLYADVLAGLVAPDRLAALVARIGVDPGGIPEILALARQAVGRGRVARIVINLARRTPPADFRLYGSRLAPTFNYFQAAVVLAADGFLEPADVAAVARGLVERSGYTPRRLENSLADLVRRGLVAGAAAVPLAAVARREGFLPEAPRGWREWWRRVVARAPRRRQGGWRTVAAPLAGPLDFDAILDRRHAQREPDVGKASVT